MMQAYIKGSLIEHGFIVFGILFAFVLVGLTAVWWFSMENRIKRAIWGGYGYDHREESWQEYIESKARRLGPSALPLLRKLLEEEPEEIEDQDIEGRAWGMKSNQKYFIISSLVNAIEEQKSRDRVDKAY